MRWPAIACLVVLAACQTAQAPKIVMQTLKVPVPTACIDPASIPAKPAAVMLPTDARQAAAMAAAQALAYSGWGDELIALIRPCTTR